MISKSYNKVFGIGLNKTGTNSLAAALNYLGIKTIHGSLNIKRSLEYEQTNHLKIFSTLDEFDGFTDAPMDRLYKLLDREYPNSKFILTVRDLEDWLISRERHVTRNQANPRYRGKWLVVEKDKWIRQWTNHQREVMDYFKDRPKDLLVMNICAGDGWEKLSPYLDLPMPNVTFPHLNRSANRKQKTKNKSRIVLEIIRSFGIRLWHAAESMRAGRLGMRQRQGRKHVANVLDLGYDPPREVSPHLRQRCQEIRGDGRRPALILHGATQRTGTNFVGALLRLHPEFCYYPNGVTEFPFLRLSSDILQMQRRFYRFHSTLQDKMEDANFLALFGASLMAYLHSYAPEGSRLLLKAPSVEHLDYFFTAFPHEHLLVLIRDGRDVVVSTLRTWPRRRFEDVCRDWANNTAIALRFHEEKAERKDGYYLVKYESVVEDPLSFIEDACRRFGLDRKYYPFDKIHDIPIIGSSSFMRNDRVSWKPVPKPQGFLPFGRWRSWSEKEKATFKRIAGSVLIQAGYCQDLGW